MMQDNRERLIRYLNDMWAVEKALVGTLKDMADEVSDPQLKAMFEQHRQETHQQEENLEARIRALGEEPKKVEGFFHQVGAKMGDALDAGHAHYEKNVQDLMKAYATEHLEMAMYQALEAFASAIGDTETAQLALRHLQQERATAEKIWAQIGPFSTRSTTQQARAA